MKIFDDFDVFLKGKLVRFADVVRRISKHVAFGESKEFLIGICNSPLKLVNSLSTSEQPIFIAAVFEELALANINQAIARAK